MAPSLAQLGDPQSLTKQLALQIHADCLNNLKQRIIDRANLIQARFEKVILTRLECLSFLGIQDNWND